MPEGKMAAMASKSRPPPTPAPLSSRSGSATADNLKVVLQPAYMELSFGYKRDKLEDIFSLKKKKKTDIRQLALIYTCGSL